MYKIYHNPRCRKSREALEFLKKNNIDHKIVLYIDTKLKPEEIKIILGKLKVDPKKLIRTHEKIWKESFKMQDLNNTELINILSEYPRIMQRPIVTFKTKGVIANPIENLKTFIELA